MPTSLAPEVVDTIEPPLPISGTAFLNREVRTLHVDVEHLVVVRFVRDIDWTELGNAGIDEEYVDAAMLFLDRFEQPVEIGCVGDVALHGNGAVAERLLRGRERALIAAEDYHFGAFADELLRGHKTDAAVVAGHDGDLSIEPAHDHLQFGRRPLCRVGRDQKMTELEQCLN
jgi:hypothetical protein